MQVCMCMCVLIIFCSFFSPPLPPYLHTLWVIRYAYICTYVCMVLSKHVCICMYTHVYLPRAECGGWWVSGIFPFKGLFLIRTISIHENTVYYYY